MKTNKLACRIRCLQNYKFAAKNFLNRKQK